METGQKFRKKVEPTENGAPVLFKVQTVNQWNDEAAARPQAARFIGELFREGELCIMFGDTGTGKSILSVQIGEIIALGAELKSLTDEFHNDANAKCVLYFDFELSDKQFQARYTDYKNNQMYTFSENFLRAEIDPDALTDISEAINESFLYKQFENAITTTGANVVIVDNITYLKHETERSKNALPLMKTLKALKSKHGLSIIAIAHTPKRDLSKPITRNDLGGSKMLINFADSSFCIGESTKDPQIRYIKQIKSRDSEIIYHADNVCVFQVQKPDCFLHFDYMGTARESEHLKFVTDPDKEELKNRALELHDHGMSYRAIAGELGISHTYVNKIIKNSLQFTHLTN